MDLFSTIKNLTAAIKARNFPDILQYAGQLLILGGSLLGPVKAGSVQCASADLESAIEGFTAAVVAFDSENVSFAAAPGEPEKAELDPGSILLILQAVSALLSFIRKK